MSPSLTSRAGGALVLVLVIAAALLHNDAGKAVCDPLGWFPQTVSVKDHTVFHHNGYTYIAAIHLPDETRFAYARSTDLCVWEVMPPILSERTPGGWDENRIWAPFVLEENGVYSMYYTGVNDAFAQSILLATTTDPADPNAWIEQGMIFQPTHPGAVWSTTKWSDNRDPTVIKRGDTYYLLYTGRDSTGGIIGLATAPAPQGPWTDLGAIVGPIEGHILESATMFTAWGSEYLVYHDTLPGQPLGAVVRTASSPLGPWSEPVPLFPGWAHEVWLDQGGMLLTSFLTSYSITMEPLNWDGAFSPPRPYIGETLESLFLPIAGESW